MLDGRCLCGGVRYTVAGKVGPFGFCHCRTCQRAQGGPFVTSAPVRTRYLSVSSGTYLVREFESSPGKWRCFCGTCGSPLWSRTRADPDTVRIRLGLVEGDPERRPLAHMWVSENPPWYEITDGLPQSPGSGEELAAAAKLP